MQKTSSKDYKHFIKSRCTTAIPIEVKTKEYYGDCSDLKILDWDCGIGRQLGHLTTALHKCSFYACDIDNA